MQYCIMWIMNIVNEYILLLFVSEVYKVMYKLSFIVI